MQVGEGMQGAAVPKRGVGEFVVVEQEVLKTAQHRIHDQVGDAPLRRRGIRYFEGEHMNMQLLE